MVDPSGNNISDTGKKATDTDAKAAANEDNIIADEEENMEIEEAGKTITNVVTLGGSNCEHLEHFLQGDEEINLRPRVLLL